MCAGMTHQPLIKAHIHNQNGRKRTRTNKRRTWRTNDSSRGKSRIIEGDDKDIGG